MTPSFVSRGGEKLHHALREFSLSLDGLTCADLGASTGGFTDCLLQGGASRVYAVDTAYGELAWKLRNDSRVTVIERANALHVPPPEPVDLVVMDLGWTPQRLAIPAALKWLKPEGRIVSLVKPHYELKDQGGVLPPKGILDAVQAQRVLAGTVEMIPSLGVRVLATTRSPLLGGSKGKGNIEWLILVGK